MIPLLQRPRLSVRTVGASAVIAELCRELKVADLVNRMVRWDSARWKVSPGTLICALIVNILTSREPLYKVEQFFRRAHVPGLFDEATLPEDFNDDALARALSRVAEIDKKALIETVGCRVVCHGGIPVRTAHADTTSISLFGQFEPTAADQRFLEANPDQKLLRITNGFSKQHRPDLKQFMYGLVVTSDGIPFTGTVRDGNFSDKAWNGETLRGLKDWAPTELQEIRNEFLDPKELVYVADSALITPDNLKEIDENKIRFISRFPETYSLADELKTEALNQGDWRDHGRLTPGKQSASYLSASFTRVLYNRRYRFVVVWSTSLDRRKWKSIQNKITREKNELAKATGKLNKRTFDCQSDAESERDKFQKENRPAFHALTVNVEAEEVIRRRPGRPRKSETPPTRTIYRLTCRVDDPSEETLTALRAKASMFILITNLHDHKAWSNQQILEEYKGQQHVEGRFRWLKHPLVVDGIFVTSQHRAEALAYVFLLALIIGAYLEQRIRRELERTQTTVEIEGDRPATARPAISAILEVLNYLVVIRVELGAGSYYAFPEDVPKRRLDMIRLAGFDPDIYLRGG